MYKLPGRFTFPKEGKNFPIVILVHGSGPHDMDETIGPNKPFKDLAEGLASKGVATLRYYKRTKRYPNEVMKEPEINIYNEVVDDALEAIKLAAAHDKLDEKKLFVLGHSLGGMLAPKIA